MPVRITNSTLVASAGSIRAPSAATIVDAIWKGATAGARWRILAGRNAARLVAVRQVELAGRGLVQANGSSNEGRESLLVDFIVLVEVDRAPGVAFEA